MSLKYVDAAREGENAWWRYLVGLVGLPLLITVSLAIFLMISLLMFGDWQLSDFRSENWVDRATRMLPVWGYYLLSSVSQSLLCAALVITIEKIHRRTVQSVVNPSRAFNYKRFLTALSVWFALRLIDFGIRYWLNPDLFTFAFNPTQWLSTLPLGVIYALLVASVHETTRGYVLQGLGLFVHQKHLLILSSALLASALSFRSTSPYDTLNIFIFGLFLASVILKENGLELTLGIQAASYLFRIVVGARLTESAVELPSIFVANGVGNLQLGFILLLIRLGVFYSILYRKN